MSDLKVCPTCGWHEVPYSSAHEDCAVQGKQAQALKAALPDLNLTQLGYGFGAIVADLSERLHVRFGIHRDGRERGASPFALREVWLLESLSVDEAASLVRAIEAWRLDMLSKRRS